MSQEKIKVFEPKDEGNYLADYPEFKDIPEFTELSEPEMKYVYYMFNQGSPFVKCSRADRHTKSIDMAFTKENIEKRFNVAATPLHIESAGEIMGKVNVGLRTQADAIVRQMFQNISNITSIDEKTVSAMDLSDKKRYVDMTISTTEALKVMISNMERGFGTRAVVSKPKETKKPEVPKGNKEENLADLAIAESKK